LDDELTRGDGARIAPTRFEARFATHPRQSEEREGDPYGPLGAVARILRRFAGVVWCEAEGQAPQAIRVGCALPSMD
jgi:hypothetical protein